MKGIRMADSRTGNRGLVGAIAGGEDPETARYCTPSLGVRMRLQ